MSLIAGIDRASPRHRQERNPALARRRGQMLDRGLAQAARGDVDHPREGHVVLGIDDQVQVGQDVLDLLTLVKRHAPHDLVGNPRCPERLLDRPRQGGHAAENRDVGEAIFTLLHQRVDPGGNPFGLVGLTRVDRQLDRLADRVFGPKRLGLAVAVEPDQVVGDADDVFRAAVIALERDDPAAREVFLELEDVRQVGPAPAVDRLVRVAGHADVGMIDRQGADDGVLCQVCILIFIDQHVTETVGRARRGRLCVP